MTHQRNAAQAVGAGSAQRPVHAAPRRALRMTKRVRSAWRWWRCMLVMGALAACSTAAPAAAIDVDPADLWWNAGEPGWGMQLVRGGSAVFATLFVYDAAGRPTFFTATLERRDATWTGDLYATAGPSFAAPVFAPWTVTRRLVGALTLAPMSAETAALQYSVDGVAVTKTVTRQPLRGDDFSGRYAVLVQRVTAHCADGGANRDETVAETLAVTQSGAVLDMAWTSASRVCRFSGNITQAGSLAATSTSYACSDGEEGTMAWFELTLRNGVLAGRFQGHGISNGCDYRGQFSGFTPS